MLVKFNLIDREKKKIPLEAEEGMTIREVIMEKLKPGNFGLCEGNNICATCHVYIDEKWINKLKNMDDDEESMLDQAFDVKNNSRLSCQIDLSKELDGLEIEIAPE